MQRPFIVGIDGPAGAGKSSTARRLAARVGFSLVDTGAIYRSVALAARNAGIAFDDDPALGALLRSVEIQFEPPTDGSPDSGPRVMLDGVDVSAEIRTPAISLGASAVSARPIVRDGLLDLQRRLATKPGQRGAVLEGRDIGTVVFPDADLKIFLTASPEIRARRRFDELSARGEAITYQQVLEDQEKRDRDDSSRAVAPLRPADDAVLFDSSAMTLDMVVDALASRLLERMGERGQKG